MTHQISKGILFALIGAFWFSLSDLLVKFLLESQYPQLQIVFFRAVFAFVPLTIWLFFNARSYELITHRPLMHFIRAAMGFVSIVSGVYALSYMKLADYTAVMFIFPLLITAMSVPFLGEKVGYHRWMAVFIGFLGVLFIVQPGYIDFNIGILIALFLAFALASISIFTRHLSWSESTPALLFWYLICHMIFSFPSVFFGWKPIESLDLLLLILAGVTAGMAQIFINESIRMAPPSITAPYIYTGLVWAILWGIIIWSQYPTIIKLFGAAVIVSSGIYIAHRETIIRKRRKG